MKKEQTVRIYNWGYEFQDSINNLLRGGWSVVSVTSSHPSTGKDTYGTANGSCLVVFEREVQTD